jgi:hypothetical protein
MQAWDPTAEVHSESALVGTDFDGMLRLVLTTARGDVMAQTKAGRCRAIGESGEDLLVIFMTCPTPRERHCRSR